MKSFLHGISINWGPLVICNYHRGRLRHVRKSPTIFRQIQTPCGSTRPVRICIPVIEVYFFAFIVRLHYLFFPS